MEYRDFQYIMSDISKIYIGAKMTYAQACAHDFMPFKLSAIINQYIYKEAAPEQTIEEHLRSLTTDSFAYMTYRTLKVRVKMNILTEEKDRFGKEKWLIDRVLTLEQYVNEESYHQYPEHALVTELIVPKLQLMAFSL